MARCVRIHNTFDLHMLFIGNKQYRIYHRSSEPDHWQYGGSITGFAFATLRDVVRELKRKKYPHFDARRNKYKPRYYSNNRSIIEFFLANDISAPHS